MTTGSLSLDELFVAHYATLVAWCRRIAPRGVDAEEIVHSTYLRMRHGYCPERVSPDHPLAYLRRSLRWEVADRLRSQRRRKKRELIAAQLQSPFCDRSPLAVAAAKEAFTTLRGRQREVCMALLSGKRRREVCRDLRMRPRSLGVYLSRARATLVRRLELSTSR
jgi:RNA polymerase sigma factor (sigma-70 family)